MIDPALKQKLAGILPKLPPVWDATPQSPRYCKTIRDDGSVYVVQNPYRRQVTRGPAGAHDTVIAIRPRYMGHIDDLLKARREAA